MTTTTDPRLVPYGSKAAWKGSEIDWRREGLHEVSAAEVEEIDRALAGLRARGEVDFPRMRASDFPLPTLGPRLAALRDELRHGRGFARRRGRPRARGSDDDGARIYFGFGAHVGRATTQSRQGEYLGHVVDISDVDSSVRGYQHGGGQNMHSDSCDIIGLMCVRAAKSGGASRIASAVAIHDELARRRPDLLRLHYDGFVYRRNELDARLGGGVVVPPVPIATFSRATGELSCYLGTNYALKAAEAGDAVLSAAQREAIAIVQELATSPAFYLDMSIGEGDIQFLNNRLVFHGRTAYEDFPDLPRRRHMLRLWLRIDSWPPLPPSQRPHSDEDHVLWERFRRPLMEMPSRFLSDVERRRSA
ncbi:MAG: TauD/TfdA family dioxygenase [Alphaproteobacteria bacterium]